MKRVKVLLFSSIIVMSLTIVGCTDNANRDEVVEEMQTQMLVSEQESEETLETLAESTVELQTETESAVVFESEAEMMPESYGPVEVLLLDYDSFRDRMTEEEWEGFEQYFPVLKENAEFYYTSFGDGVELNKDGEPVKDGEYPLFERYASEEMMDINRFVEMCSEDGVWEIEDIRVFDLDGDGVQELIIQWTPVGEILVLHREDDAFYAWEIMYRGFETLGTNGVYISSGGAGANCWKRIRFENGSWMEEVLFEEDWGKFYLNGEPVDEETFLEQVQMVDTAEEVTRYEPKKSALCGLPLNTDKIAKVYNWSEENGVMKTYYEMKDGTWECDGITYPFRLELVGRMPNAVKDSCYVVLTDNADLTFDEVSKSMFSSSMEYINKVMEGSVIVELK